VLKAFNQTSHILQKIICQLFEPASIYVFILIGISGIRGEVDEKNTHFGSGFPGLRD
jgi:hypothetical protein